GRSYFSIRVRLKLIFCVTRVSRHHHGIYVKCTARGFAWHSGRAATVRRSRHSTGWPGSELLVQTEHDRMRLPIAHSHPHPLTRVDPGFSLAYRHAHLGRTEGALDVPQGQRLIGNHADPFHQGGSQRLAYRRAYRLVRGAWLP